MKEQKDKENTILIRLDKDLKSKATTEAAKENRSFNKYIVNLIQVDLKQKGAM